MSEQYDAVRAVEPAVIDAWARAHRQEFLCENLGLSLRHWQEKIILANEVFF